jgi:hypothetical protein
LIILLFHKSNTFLGLSEGYLELIFFSVIFTLTSLCARIFVINLKVVSVKQVCLKYLSSDSFFKNPLNKKSYIRPPPPPNLTLLIAVLFLIRLLALQLSIIIPTPNFIRKTSMIKKNMFLTIFTE